MNVCSMCNLCVARRRESSRFIEGSPVRRYLQHHLRIYSHRVLEKLTFRSRAERMARSTGRTLEDIFKESIQMIHDSEKSEREKGANESREGEMKTMRKQAEN